MKIIVPIKQVIDAGARIRVKSDGSGVDPSGVRMIVNPFDEIALEEAVRLKEAGKATEVIAVTIAGDPPMKPCAPHLRAVRTEPCAWTMQAFSSPSQSQRPSQNWCAMRVRNWFWRVSSRSMATTIRWAR